MKRQRRRAGVWDRVLVRCSALVTLGAVIAAGSAAVARADVVDDYVLDNAPIVCQVLDKYPSVAGIEGIGAAIMDDGLSSAAAGEVVTRSIVGWCPEYAPVLRAFIAKWSTAKRVIA